MAKHISAFLDPATGDLDISALLAFHRAQFGDARMDGEGDSGGDGGSSGGSSGGTGSGSGSGAPAAGENGFPANTPLEQMSSEQREAYWKHQARKHEDRVKSFGGITPEQLATLRERAAAHDALERELMSDKDKAVADAADRAKAETRAEFTPRLVHAEFRAAAAGRIEAERLAAILEPLDMTKFLNDSGEVNTDKVSAFIDGIAPVKGGTPEPERRGPSPAGQGKRPGSAPSGNSLAAGRELYQQRYAKRT